MQITGKKSPKISKIIFCVLLVVGLQGCERPDDKLRQRATKWGELLVELESLPKGTAITRLSDYIEPSAARDARAEEYYRMWMTVRETPTVAFSIDQVMLNEGDNTGIVRYTSVLQLDNGVKKTASQQTEWRLIDGRWYRIIAASQKILND